MNPIRELEKRNKRNALIIIFMAVAGIIVAI